MVSLPKIDLGIKRRKAFFDKTHDVNTTADFGFVQPTLVEELIPGTHVELKTNTFIRLAPMPQPTFARVQCRQYNNFVPMKEVFMAFDYMMSNKSVSSSVKTYTPKQTDYITVKELFEILFAINNKTQSEGVDYSKLFFTLVCYGENGTYSDNETFLKSCFNYIHNHYFSLNSTIYENATLSSVVASYTENSQNVVSALDTSQGMSLDDENEYRFVNYLRSNPPSIDNADFVFKYETLQAGFVIGLHLTPRGQRLFKVLRGLGIQFKYLDAKIPLTLFFAYYKTWFDIFNPGRDLHWKNTNAYKLVHTYFDFNLVLSTFTHTHSVPSGVPNGVWNSVTSSFKSFIFDLTECCYTLDLDPLTVCMQNPWQNATELHLSSRVDMGTNDVIDSTGIGYATGEDAYIQDGYINSFLVNALQKIQPFLNKNSVIGQRVDEYMKVHYGQQVERGNFIGSGKFSCQISDLFQTAPGLDSVVGEYYGKGVGFGDNKVSFDAKEFGIMVQLTVIVPFGGYSQSLGENMHVAREDFYLREADSLGYEAVPMSSIFGSSSVIRKRSNETFGFRPRFMGYKYKNNLRNGDFARRGRMPELMPYNLDRFFREDDVVMFDNGGETHYHFVNGIEHQVNEALRFIGKSEDYGNYNRLFFDTTGFEDNFIIDMIQEFKINAPMIPIAQSYDTFDSQSNGDNGTVSVQHS